MKIPQSGMMHENPAFPLLQSVISYWGTTTGAGAATGLTLVDGLCSTAGLQPEYSGISVKLLNGNAAGQVRLIDAHDLATGTITVSVPFTDYNGAVYQVPAGTRFCIGAVGSGGIGSKWAGWDTMDTHDIEIAHGVAEQNMLTIANDGRYSFSVYVDLSTLVTAAEGGTVTVRLYNEIDGVNPRVIAESSFTVGVSTINPSFEIVKITGECTVTIQLSVAVTAQRTITYHYTGQDME